MPITPASDVVQATAMAAMNALSTRQQVLADNLANAATPGFHARRVDFESSLAASLSSTGSPAAMAVSVTDAGGPQNADGNSVDVAADTLALQGAQLAFESSVAAMNFRLSIMADGLSR